MTPQLDTLAELLAKATPGEWIVHSEPDVNYPPTIHALGSENPVPFHTVVEPLHQSDQYAIVAAVNFLRDNLPAIREHADEVERLRKALHSAVSAMTCHGKSACYCPNCDTSLDSARSDALAALNPKQENSNG